MPSVPDEDGTVPTARATSSGTPANVPIVQLAAHSLDVQVVRSAAGSSGSRLSGAYVGERELTSRG